VRFRPVSAIRHPGVGLTLRQLLQFFEFTIFSSEIRDRTSPEVTPDARVYALMRAKAGAWSKERAQIDPVATGRTALLRPVGPIFLDM
jgi:hypothetical protein